VNWFRKGVVSAAGLLPLTGHRWKFAKFRVLTILGGDRWVVRPLQPRELVGSLDIPEQMLLDCHSPGEVSLLEHLTVPIKGLQGCCLLVQKLFPHLDLNGGVKRQRESSCTSVSFDAGPKTKRRAIQVGESTSLRHCENSSASDVDLDPKAQSEVVSCGLAALATPPGEVLDGGAERNLKAVKNDQAPVPIELWNHFLEKGLPEVVKSRPWQTNLSPLHEFGLRCWRRSILRGYIRWRSIHRDESLDFLNAAAEAARDAISRAADASWWEWCEGSRPFFWNWPEEVQEMMMTGLRWWIRDGFVPKVKKQRAPPELAHRLKIAEKLKTVRRRGYLEKGVITAFMFFFDVPKGIDDIRMVYDGTGSGLNDVLWAPWFILPTVDSLLRALVPGTYMSDNDVGEMFLNFMLHEEVRQLSGVDLTALFPTEVPNYGDKVAERWSRPAMGLRPSPYTAVKGILWADEVIKGDPDKPDNVFRWSKVRLNLPGDKGYDPTLPWVSKIRKDGMLASDLFIYINDLRPTGPTELETWSALQQTSSVLAWLGLQDAARKRRPTD